MEETIEEMSVKNCILEKSLAVSEAKYSNSILES